MSSPVELQTGASTIHLELHWPEGHGTLDDALTDAVSKACERIEDEGQHGVVIVRGLGGSDPDTHIPPAPTLEQCRRWEAAIHRLERLPVVSLAVIDGACVASSLQIALACDFRLATTRSTLRLPAVVGGFLPGLSTFRLAKTCGLGIARRLVLGGERLDAQAAAAAGVVDYSCDAGALAERLASLTRELSRVDGDVVRLARRLLYESFATPYEDAIGHYLAAQSHCLARLGQTGK